MVVRRGICLAVLTGVIVSTSVFAAEAKLPSTLNLTTPVPLTFRARDKSEFNHATNELDLRGDVQLRYKDLDLSCDELRLNLEEDWVEGCGHVKITQGANFFTGDRFHYRFSTRQGTIDNAHVQLDGLDYTGEEIIVDGPAIHVKNATVTACQSPRHHFEIRSEQIDYLKGKSVTLRRSYLVVGGHRLFRIPKFTKNLQRGTGIYNADQGFSPILFVNARDGIFLGGQYAYQFTPGTDHWFGAMNFGYSAVRGFRGGPDLGFEHRDFLVVLRSRYHETADYHFNPALLVDIRPEISIQNTPITVMPHRLAAYGVASYGFFKELPSNLTGARRTMQFHLDTRPATPGYKYFAHAFFRRSDYSNSIRSLTAYGAEFGTHGKLSQALEGDFLIGLQEVGGGTPFQFDEVLIAKELQAKFDYRMSRAWIVPFLVRYDIQRNSIRDLRLGLMRAYDCVAYGMSFDTARREFRFEGRFLLRGNRQTTH